MTLSSNLTRLSGFAFIAVAMIVGSILLSNNFANAQIASYGFGYVDGFNNDTQSITGWIHNPDYNIERNMKVNVFVQDQDGSLLLTGSAWATEYRRDVEEALGVTGTHGFTYNVPQKYLNGATYTFYIDAVDENTRDIRRLDDNGIRINFMNEGAKGDIDGANYSDYTNMSMISGWAIDNSAPNDPAVVMIFTDELPNGEFITATETFKHRADVNSAFSSSGDHGYDLFLDGEFTGTPKASVYILNKANGTLNLVGTRQLQ